MSRALTTPRHRTFHAAPFAESKHQEVPPLWPFTQTLSFNIDCVWYEGRRTRIESKRKEMKDEWENRRDRWRERQLGRGGTIVGVVVMVTAEGGGLKVAVPVFEARLIKTLVQYLRWRGKAKRRRGEKSGPGRISNPLSEGFPN